VELPYLNKEMHEGGWNLSYIYIYKYELFKPWLV
jgi:hypothetical protein